MVTKWWLCEGRSTKRRGPALALKCTDPAVAKALVESQEREERTLGRKKKMQRSMEARSNARALQTETEAL